MEEQETRPSAVTPADLRHRYMQGCGMQRGSHTWGGVWLTGRHVYTCRHTERVLQVQTTFKSMQPWGEVLLVTHMLCCENVPCFPHPPGRYVKDKEVPHSTPASKSAATESSGRSAEISDS